MISQSAYYNICEYIRESDTPAKVDLKSFLRPYVLIIHRPSGRGFYLDRDYRHILDVANCQEPKNPVEATRRHLGACGNMPAWVMAEKSEEFDTFWLY